MQFPSISHILQLVISSEHEMHSKLLFSFFKISSN